MGRDWLRRGTVTIKIRDAKQRWVTTKLDYRQAGSLSGVPSEIPMERCKRTNGIDIYDESELATRKLATK